MEGADPELKRKPRLQTARAPHALFTRAGAH
jgi:hypothetical protein